MDIFRIRKGEIAIFAIGVALMVWLNVMMTGYNRELFARGGNLGFWTIFYDHFTLSGYDPFVYITLSRWKIYYTLSRHPLITPLLYPLAMLNNWLMAEAGTNCAIYIVAALYSLLGAYSFLFTYRTMRHVIGICAVDSLILTLFFFSIGHISMACFVPDHFAMSLFLLTLTAYMAGMHIRRGTQFSTLATAALATITAGVTLTNVAKTWLAAWWTNGKRFCHVKSLALTVLLPIAIVGSCYWAQYEYMLKPDQEIQTARIKERLKKEPKFAEKYYAHKKWMENRRSFNGTNNSILEWVDTKTNKWDTVVENLFGESIQLHDQWLLGDTNESRPVIVRYGNVANYVVEMLIVVLFIMGIVAGRRNKFCLMIMSWFAVDMVMHIAIGFALTEVYIMTAHWALAMPVAIAYLVLWSKSWKRIVLRTTLLAVTVWLFAWNIPLIMSKL